MRGDVAQPARRSHTQLSLRALVALALAVAACSGGGTQTPAADADAGVDADASPDVSAGPCSTGLVCDGDLVRACVDGGLGDVVQACPLGDTCSLGRCTSSACAMAEAKHTGFGGCLFYSFQPENVTSDSSAATSFLVTNPSSATATVSLEVPAVGGDGTASWAAQMGPTPVDPGQSARFTLTNHAVISGGSFLGAAIRISSDVPVAAVEVVGDDSDQTATTSSAGTTLLPAQTLGSHYRAMTYPQADTPAVAAIDGSRGGAARVAIVSTQDGTDVSISLPADISSILETPQPLPTELMVGSTLYASLNDGDVFQVYTTDDGADLSGTEISASAPIAVFSGNITTSYGIVSGMDDVSSPDMAHEQMPPVGAWSTHWVAAELPAQVNVCTSLFGAPGSSIWRVLASEDGTNVMLDAPQGVTVSPPSTQMLNKGQVAQLISSGGSFQIQANKPVLVTQGLDCEPSLSLAVSLDHLLDDYAFAVLPNFDQLVSVVRPAEQPEDTIMLDGTAISSSLFGPAGNGYEVAQVPIPPCGASMQVCTHRLSGGHFGMTLRGMDVLSSYALTAPTFAGCVDVSDPTCIVP